MASAGVGFLPDCTLFCRLDWGWDGMHPILEQVATFRLERGWGGGGMGACICICPTWGRAHERGGARAGSVNRRRRSGVALCAAQGRARFVRAEMLMDALSKWLGAWVGFALTEGRARCLWGRDSEALSSRKGFFDWL